MDQLLKKYDELRKYIYIVINENKHDDEVVDNLDILEQKEEEFAIDLEDYLSD